MNAEPKALELYRLERTLVGERLVPVSAMDDATHASSASVRSVVADRERTIGALRSQLGAQQQRLLGLEQRCGTLAAQEKEAQAVAAQRATDLARAEGSIRRLVAKTAALISEKRRLRDALIGKQPLPAIHYRIDVDRDGTARESSAATLDTFPHKERVGDALAEARRLAERRGGMVRQLRLDTVAWRAVIQLTIDGE